MEKDININIGLALKKLRKNKIVEKQKILDILQISAQQLNKYENGKNRISASKLFLLLKTLGIDFNSFFGMNNIQEQKIIANYNKITNVEIKNSIVRLVETISSEHSYK